MKSIRSMLLAARPWSFSMTAISVVLAAVASAGETPFRWGLSAMVLVGMILIHAATNLMNDYFDVRHGVDTPDSPTAQYRAHPVLEGTFTPRQILGVALALYAVAAAIGVVLTLERGPVVLIFAAAGGLASFFYTAGPVKYKHLALGELSVFLMWGPLMMLATSTVLTGDWSRARPVVLLSLPQGLWVALVIYANNLKDIAYDEDTGVRTLANLLRPGSARRLFVAFLAVIYALHGVLVGLRVIPLWGLIGALSLVPAGLLAGRLLRTAEVPADADPKTAQAGMVYGVLLIVSFLLDLVV